MTDCWPIEKEEREFASIEEAKKAAIQCYADSFFPTEILIYNEETGQTVIADLYDNVCLTTFEGDYKDAKNLLNDAN